MIVQFLLLCLTVGGNVYTTKSEEIIDETCELLMAYEALHGNYETTETNENFVDTNVTLSEVESSYTTFDVRGVDCQFIIQLDIDNKKAPVLVNPNLQSLVQPSVVTVGKSKLAAVYVKDGDKIVLGCTGEQRGKSNKNTLTGKVLSDLSCKAGAFKLNTYALTKNDFMQKTSCDFLSRSTYVINRNTPNPNMDLVKIGFQLSANTFIPGIVAVHEISTMRSVFAASYIHGKSIAGAVRDVGRPDFIQENNLYGNLDLTELYSKDEQEKTLMQLLNTNKYFDRDRNYIAKGHLASDADQVTVPEQRMTYYYSNVAPQWQPFNCGPWLRIEKATREVAVKKADTLEVYTGTVGVLQLYNGKGRLTQIFLDIMALPYHIPVPAYFWKIVRQPSTNQCIVVVGVNDVYRSSAPPKVCTTGLSRNPSGWPSETNPSTASSTGYTYYCNYQSFANAMQGNLIPTIQCSSILEV